jgi:hypothetical protein
MLTNLSDDPQKVLELICTKMTHTASKTLSIIHKVQQLVSQECENMESPVDDEEVQILPEHIPGKVQIFLEDK